MNKNRWFWIAAFVSIVFDQITKYWAVDNYDLIKNSLPVWPGVFHLTFVMNRGAAFGIFSDESWLRWLSLGVSLFLIVMVWSKPYLPLWEQLGYGLILGGAVGNGIDRFGLNFVIDFLHFPIVKFPVFNWEQKRFFLTEFPVFNFADVFINVGIICLLIAYFGKPEQNGSHEKRQQDREQNTEK